MTPQHSVADRLGVLALLLAVIAAAGLLVPGLYRDTGEMIRQARATDVITLAAARLEAGSRPASFRRR